MTQSRRDKGRTGWKKWALGTLKWGSIAAAVLLVVGVIGVVIAYNRTSIPQPNQLANKQVSIVYYSDGKTELDRIAVQDGNRESVPLSKVPKFVQDAHIAAEDRTFYQNNGISVGGILRAVKTSVTGETQVGGSTITQQYVKNYFLTPGPDHLPQGQGDPHRRQDRRPALQVRDPREVPQHHLLRPWRLRHPERGEGVLRQGRLPAHRR